MEYVLPMPAEKIEGILNKMDSLIQGGAGEISILQGTATLLGMDVELYGITSKHLKYQEFVILIVEAATKYPIAIMDTNGNTTFINWSTTK